MIALSFQVVNDGSHKSNCICWAIQQWCEFDLQYDEVPLVQSIQWSSTASSGAYAMISPECTYALYATLYRAQVLLPRGA